MPFPNEIQNIVTAMSQAEGSDFVAITRESSMLPPVLERQITANYNNVLWPHYKELFEKLGGTDKILEDLEEHIAKKIDQYHAEKNNSRNNNNNNSANTPGTKARKEFNFRKEFKGELGEYHSALRVLLDSGNLLTLHNLAFGTSHTWPNLLHKGSNVKYQGIPLRTLLAVYWLAAKDSDMQIAETFQEELATPGKREEFLKSSINIFISLLAEIRRAHNEDQYQEATLDSPSCDPGTFGRITARSSIYNKLTALPATPYARIPKEIENFIIKKLKEAAPAVRIAVFNTINNTLAYNDVNEQEREICNQCIKSLSEPAIFEELLVFLAKEINSHPHQRHINLRLLPVHESIRKLIAIMQRDLDMENPNSRPDSNFIIRILEIGLITLGDNKLQTVINEPLVEFRLSLRQLDHEISVLERLINNELIRGLLAPAYFSTTKAKEKLNWLSETAIQKIELLISLRNNFDKLVKNKKTEIVEQLQDETECNHEINAENLSSFKLPKSTAERFDKLVVKVDKLEDKIEFAVAKRTEYIKTLPALPGHQADYANRTPEQWAANILRIASEKEKNGDLVRDTREIERNIELMQDNLSPASIHQVLQLINAKLKQPEIILAKDRAAIKQLINDKLKEKQLDLDSQVAQIAPDTISILPIIFEAQVIGIYDSKIAEINFCLTKDFNKTEFEKWQTAIAALLDNNVHANINKLQTAVLLTLFVNLGISEMKQGDAQTIRDLCEYYIGTMDASGILLLHGYVPPSLSLNERINRLAEHLALIITNLKEVSLLFQAGWIRLLSKDEAETQVEYAKARGLEKPFIIRVSNRNPSQLALTYINPATGKADHRHCNLLAYVSPIMSRQAATVSVEYNQNSSSSIYHYTLGSQSLNLVIKRINFDDIQYEFYAYSTEFLSYLILHEHSDYPTKTPAAGCDISLQEINSNNYRAQAENNFQSAYISRTALNANTPAIQTPKIIETTQKLEQSFYIARSINNNNNNNAASHFAVIQPTSSDQKTISRPQISPPRNDLAPRIAPTTNGNSMAQSTPTIPASLPLTPPSNTAAVQHTVAPNPVTIIPQTQSNRTQATPTIRETTQNIENNAFQRARATSHMVNSLLNLSWSDDSTLNLSNSLSPITISPMTTAAVTPAAQPVRPLTPSQTNNIAQSTQPIAAATADAITITSPARPNTAAITNNINSPTTSATPLSTTQANQTTAQNLNTAQSINNNSQAQSRFFLSIEKLYLKSMKNVTSQQKDAALKALEEDLNNLGTMSVMHNVHSIFSAISTDTNILRQHRENYIYSSGNTDSYKSAIQLIINKIASIRISFQEYSYILEILKAAIQCKLVENDIINAYKQTALVQLQVELTAQQDLQGINNLFLQVTGQQSFLRYERRNILFNYGDTDSYAAAILAIARRASTVQLLGTENERHMFDNIMSKFDACFNKHSNEQEWLTAHQNLHRTYTNNFRQQALRI